MGRKKRQESALSTADQTDSEGNATGGTPQLVSEHPIFEKFLGRVEKVEQDNLALSNKIDSLCSMVERFVNFNQNQNCNQDREVTRHPNWSKEMTQRPNSVSETVHVKVRQFDPSETDWFDYKNYFEAIASQSNWSESTKCAKLLGAIPISLSSVVTGLKTPFAFSELLERIEESQNVICSQEEARIKLVSIKKKSDESIPMFAEKVRQLTQRAYPHYASTDKETHALQAFVQGLSENPDLNFQMQMQSFKTLQEAKQYAMRVDKAISVKTPKPLISHRNVEEVEIREALKETTEELRKLASNVRTNTTKDEKENIPDKSDLKKPQNSGGNAKRERLTPQNSPCHFCGQYGHWKYQCPYRERKQTNHIQPSFQSQSRVAHDIYGPYTPSEIVNQGNVAFQPPSNNFQIPGNIMPQPQFLFPGHNLN